MEGVWDTDPRGRNCTFVTLRPDLGNIFLFYEFLHGVISYVSKILFFQKMYIRILASLRTAF